MIYVATTTTQVDEQKRYFYLFIYFIKKVIWYQKKKKSDKNGKRWHVRRWNGEIGSNVCDQWIATVVNSNNNK